MAPSWYGNEKRAAWTRAGVNVTWAYAGFVGLDPVIRYVMNRSRVTR